MRKEEAAELSMLITSWKQRAQNLRCFAEEQARSVVYDNAARELQELLNSFYNGALVRGVGLEDMISAKRSAEVAVRRTFHRKYGRFWKCDRCGAYMGRADAPEERPVGCHYVCPGTGAVCLGQATLTGYSYKERES